MRPSPNPSSAGTYPSLRRYSVGDDVVHLVSDNYGIRTQTITSRVTAVDEEADRVEFNDGESVVDSMGNGLKRRGLAFEPRSQIIPAEVQIGNRWTPRFRAIENGQVTDVYIDFRVAAREKVRVPAGEFDAFRIEGYGGPHRRDAGSCARYARAQGQEISSIQATRRRNRSNAAGR